MGGVPESVHLTYTNLQEAEMKLRTNDINTEDSSWMKIDDCLHYLIFTLKVTIIFTNIFQKQ